MSDFNIEALTWAVRLGLNLERAPRKQTFQAKFLLAELAGQTDESGYADLVISDFRKRLNRSNGTLYSVKWLGKWLAVLASAGHISYSMRGDLLSLQLIGYPTGASQ